MQTNGPTGSGGATRSYVLFTVAGTTYALPSEHVRHLEMVDQITAIPNAAPFVEGVVFSRGQVVPVVNLRVRFGFERGLRDLRSRLLVVDVNGRAVGLLADDAREFVPIADEAIRRPGEAIAGLSGDYLTGVAMLNERIVLVLSVTRVVDAAPTVAA